MPMMKPVITEYETKRVNFPNRSRPNIACKAPINTTMRNRAVSRASPCRPPRACPAESEAALVVTMIISRVLEMMPPAIGPTMQA